MSSPLGSLRNLRVLCIGNGGMISRHGQLWNHRIHCDFVSELGGLVNEVCLCGWSEPSDDPLAQTALHGMAGVRAIGLPPVHGSAHTKLVNGIRSFAILAREVLRADFVYVYWPGRIASITAGICRAAGRPYGIYYRGTQTRVDHAFRSAFRRAAFALAAGQLLKNEAEAYCRDVENVTPMTYVRQEHILPPRAPRRSGPWQLLYVGRLEQSKGVQDLLAALSHLDGLPFELTMVGHCPDQNDLQAHLPPSIASRVRLVGVVGDFEQLVSIYRKADIFVFPSHEEGFPRVLYEAMALGVPIVTTFVGGISNVMKDGENCLRIAVKDPKDMADKIRRLATSPDLQTQLVASAHESVSELMKTWQRSHAVQIAERLQSLFRTAN